MIWTLKKIKIMVFITLLADGWKSCGIDCEQIKVEGKTKLSWLKTALLNYSAAIMVTFIIF